MELSALGQAKIPLMRKHTGSKECTGSLFQFICGEGESSRAANEFPSWRGVSAPVIVLSGDGHVVSR